MTHFCSPTLQKSAREIGASRLLREERTWIVIFFFLCFSSLKKHVLPQF